MAPSYSSSSSSSRHEATTNTCRFFQLPHPLIMDILSRLPINDLVHCRRVCKTFLCFVSDPEFACLHLSRSPLCILIKTKPPQVDSNRLELFHVDANGANLHVSKLNFTPKSNIPTCDFSYMSACNGLLCLVGSKIDNPFYVCNPILGELITIQPPYKDGYRSFYWGLGYSTVTNQYKLLVSTYYSANRSAIAEIYTIGTGTWRSIGNPPTGLVSFPSNAFLNGARHWCSISPESRTRIFIHSFDYDAEQFGTVTLPDHFQNNREFDVYPFIGVLGGCLFIIDLESGRQYDIWVMKEYGVKESWTKQFVIEDFYPNTHLRDYYEPLVVLSNGEILMMHNHRVSPTKKINCRVIVCYNQKRKQLRETDFLRTRPAIDAIACYNLQAIDYIVYAPCFVSLHNVARGEQISRMQSTKVYDKICKEEFLCL